MRAVQFRKSVWRFLLVKALGHRFPALLTSPFGLVTLREQPPLPLPSPHWVRVRPKLCGICGSDLAVLTGKTSLFLSPLTSVPFTFGHEIVGVVVETGEEVTKVKAGERVVIEPALSCFVREINPPCPRCAEGNYACCERLTEGVIGAGVQTGYCRDTGGGLSDEFIAHERQLFPVPDTLSDEEAVLVEPFSCALHAVLRARRWEPLAQKVLVIGCGAIGLLTIAAWRVVEAKLALPRTHLVAVGKYAHQRDWAKRLGADEVVASDKNLYRHLSDLTGAKLLRPELGKPSVLGGFDLVFDCVGNQSSLNDAIRWARADGLVIVAGMPSEPKVTWTSLWFKELRVVGAYAYGMEEWQGERVRTFDLTLQWLQEGSISLKGLVTHRFPLTEWKSAVQTALQAGRRGAVKVALHP